MPDCNDSAASRMPGTLWTGPVFAEAFKNCCRPIYAFCYRKLGNHADAEDATQQTFLQVWKSRARYDPTKAPGGLCGYLRTVASHICGRMLDARSGPVVVKITSEDHAAAIAGELFAFELQASPDEATCALADHPQWLSLERGESPAFRLKMQGTPPQTGEWMFGIVAEHNKTRAEQTFTLRVVSRREDLAAAKQLARPPGPRRRTEGRAEIGIFDEEISGLHDDPPPPGDEAAKAGWLLDRLPERERKVMIMSYIEDKSAKEIASALDISEDNTRQILSRARKHLRAVVMYIFERKSVPEIAAALGETETKIRKILQSIRKPPGNEDSRNAGNGPAR